MRLVGTPVSHFTRKVRLLLDHLDTAYEFVDMGNVASADAAQFAGHPLMNVPVLHDGGAVVYDSDHIAAYIARKHNPADRFEVLTQDVTKLNARAVLNGAMSAVVRVVLAERMGAETLGQPFFDKARRAINNALDWCEAGADMFNCDDPTYLEFHIISFWDHLRHYDLMRGDWPKLSRVAAQLSEQPLIARSFPP